MGDLKLRVPLDNGNAPCGVTKSKSFFLIAVVISILITLFFDISSAISSNEQERDAQEATQIARFKDSVKREGDTLLLKSKSGTFISLENDHRCGNYATCFSFKFFDYFKDIGFYVIENYYLEGGQVMMVSDSDGEKYFIHELPLLSPDKKHIVTIPDNIDTGDGESGVFVWRFNGGKLIQEFSYRPREYFVYKSMQWKNNSHIELKEWLRSSKGLCPETRYMIVPVNLKMEDGDWKLYEDYSSDSVKCDTNYMKEAEE